MIKYLLLLTVFPLTMNAQETPNPQFTNENNNVDNCTRSIYGSVGLITYTDRQSGSTHIGTGTLIAKPFITEGEREAVKFYLVTNKHVLHQANAASEITFRSEEHTSELQSLMRISYAVFCLKTKKNV